MVEVQPAIMKMEYVGFLMNLSRNGGIPVYPFLDISGYFTWEHDHEPWIWAFVPNWGISGCDILKWIDSS